MQLIDDEVDFVAVPLVPSVGPASLHLYAVRERHVADIDFAAVVQQRAQIFDENDLLRVRQVMQGIGRDNRVISVLFQRLDQPLCKIALISSAFGILTLASSIIRCEKSCPYTVQPCS